MDHTLYSGNNAYFLARQNELNQLRRNDPRFEQVISDLEQHKIRGKNVDHYIANMIPDMDWYNLRGEPQTRIGVGSQLQRMGNDYKNYIKFSPEIDRSDFTYTKDFSNLQILIHELKHDWNDSYGGGLDDNILIDKPGDKFDVKYEEADVVNFQNIQREIECLPARTQYVEDPIPKSEWVSHKDYKLRYIKK